MGILEKIDRLMRSAEDKLREEIEINQYYPFTVVEPNVYRLSVRYKKLYVAIAGLLVSLMFIITWTSTNLVQKNNLFLFPLFGAIISILSIYNYRANRIYLIDMNALEYTFSHDQNLYTRGELHNVYIRLKREARGTNVGGGRQKRYYYLVFNGYQMDQRRISGSSPNMQEMRRLGQLIAANLNLNYFDENNSSEHHVLRHLRATKGQTAAQGGYDPAPGRYTGPRGISQLSGMFRKEP
ncbi:hypothetical protein GGF31_002365 [Allomyces arbusculus]|nr:hypothetical protein GGF31_002365 [Allomyces arbusculus]